MNTTIIRRLAQLINDLKTLGAIKKEDNIESSYSDFTKILYVNIYIDSIIRDKKIIEKAFKAEFADCINRCSIKIADRKISFELARF